MTMIPQTKSNAPAIASLVLGVLAALSVIGLAGCTAGAPPVAPQRVTVPDVIGLPLDDAVAALTEIGLDSSYASGDGSTIVLQSNWTVDEQDPGAGTSLAAGDKVHLVASKPEGQPESSPSTSAGCLVPSAGAIASLRETLDAVNGAGVVTIGRTAATVATERESAWFVGAELLGDGIPAGSVAIWATRYDPTAEGENAYLSVNGFAELFSDYIRPTGTVTFSLTEGGVREVEGCVLSL
jgi:hypothetical protein